MRELLERRQVWFYLSTILIGLIVGRALPGTTQAWEPWLWPLVGCLLYTTFTQVPLTHLAPAFKDSRFLAPLLLGNFVVMPTVIGLLLWLLPDVPALKLGVLLVLLVPCTDWFVSFSYLGRGDAGRALAATPVLLLAQLLLLPLYLWLFMGRVSVELALWQPLSTAFVGLILVPMALAWATEQLAARLALGKRLVTGLGWLPIPLLAAIVFLIASTQVTLVWELGGLLWPLLLVFVLYLVAAATAGPLLGRLFRLPPASARTLTFSLGTRNSFVVLPLALTLPYPWEAAVVVVVFQSLVELFGMIAFLKWVPSRLIPDHSS